MSHCWFQGPFSSLQVFQVRKVVGAGAGKIFAMKVLKKVMKELVLHLALRSGQTVTDCLSPHTAAQPCINELQPTI